MIDIKERLYSEYSEMQSVIDKFDAGDASVAEVKKQTAPYGIYREKDGRYMFRSRHTGGLVTVGQLDKIAGIMDRFGIDYGHLSTRQNIQLHNIKGEDVQDALLAFEEEGMAFRGGGGDTARNVIASSYSGVDPDEVFDVLPYALKTWEWLYGYQKAFELPRKFKVGFSSSAADDCEAVVQDLGFIARQKDGVDGFKVYCGGGMGRNASLGVVLFDFIAADQFLKVVEVAVNLFYDHGDRNNRAKARLRFVLKRLGEERFVALFMEYFNKSELGCFELESFSLGVDQLVKGVDEAPCDDYADWIDVACRESKFKDVVSVRLFVGKGNFSADDFRTLSQIVKDNGGDHIRITLGQDAIIPAVHVSYLPFLYNALKERLPEQAPVTLSFKDHIVSCIGASICSVGILDASSGAKLIEDALETVFSEYSSLKNELFEDVVNSIRITGCSSLCARIQATPIGFHGLKKKVDGVLTEFYQLHIGANVSDSDESNNLALTQPDWVIPVDKLGLFIGGVLKSFIKCYLNNEASSIKEFMNNEKADFNLSEYI